MNNNGNLTNDNFHTYGWDAEGNLITVDSTSTAGTFDALNRRVELGSFATIPSGTLSYDANGNLTSDGTYTLGLLRQLPRSCGSGPLLGDTIWILQRYLGRQRWVRARPAVGKWRESCECVSGYVYGGSLRHESEIWKRRPVRNQLRQQSTGLPAEKLLSLIHI